MLNSYPSVYALGHKAVSGIFDDPVIIQEKCDGSQISLGIIDGELQMRSKGKQLILDAPDAMFTKAVEVARSLDLHPGWAYRGEYLKSPKHNTISYGRVPKNNIILFDICTGLEEYMPYDQVVAEASRIGLEVVPQLFIGKVESFEQFKGLLETESILGGSKIEGVVIKCYTRFTAEKKAMMAKYVREEFQEENAKDFRARNPTKSDIIQELILKYKTEARWRKSAQHLKESGSLEGSPKDIALLIREVPADVLKEAESEIKEALFKFAWHQIQRGIVAGLPEFYKNELAKSAFDKDGK